MGRVAGAYGVRGWLKAVPGGGVLDTLAAAEEWWIGGRAYPVIEAKVHGTTVVAKLAGMESPEQAERLKGDSVWMRRDALPDPGEGRYYLDDLVGLEVVNEQGERLGVVARLFSNGAQDVMEVAGERTYLMPWVSSVVKEVDLPARQITVEWGRDW
ncbi:MAG TPA: ribosome maturation factor RimM [Burkholderiales bacterium]|nr:ribosome maturation factor RimM [Burkholderiales bacterium]